ncbi:MAG TPA: GNAT family N-acetyltransferase [Phycisphaerae bacterium]|nr:GNAT family N-acetyltransferase [Phycisphaerae bacterium]
MNQRSSNSGRELQFARAAQEDLPAVVELCMLVEAQHEAYMPLRWQRRPGLHEGYLGWLSRRLGDERMLIQVARDPALPGPRDLFGSTGGAVVGCILVTIDKEIPIYTYSEYAFIQDMAVRETHRRRGIAQRLLADAAEWARGHGLSQLRLMVADQNPGARAAFEKAGFLPTYQEMILPL